MVRSSIIFTAAGSGGHIFAAIATVKAFQSQYPTLAKEIVFVGSTLTMEGEKRQLPMEERLCGRMGIPFRKIRMGKIQRQFSLNSIKLFGKIILGFIDAWKLVSELRPKVVVAFGGYVSFPMIIIGKLFGSKIILHEQTSSIGLVNKLLQRLANVVAVTFETSLPYFKKPAIVVGSPTMFHIYGIKTCDHLLSYLDKSSGNLLESSTYIDKLCWLYDQKGKFPILLMSGGSQGSHFLNDKIRAILAALLKDMIVVLQVGENEYYNDFSIIQEYVLTLPCDLEKRCILRRFVYEEYGFLMNTADLFLGRSGANTVYQVGMNGTPAIFVPIPWVTKNEQYTNAMILQEKGLATIIEEQNCTPELLLATIKEQIAKIVSNRSKKGAKREPIFPLDADKRLAQEIGKLAI